MNNITRRSICKAPNSERQIEIFSEKRIHRQLKYSKVAEINLFNVLLRHSRVDLKPNLLNCLIDFMHTDTRARCQCACADTSKVRPLATKRVSKAKNYVKKTKHR